MRSFLRLPALALLLAFVITTLTSCDAIAGIFKAGFYSAFIVIAIVVLLILFIVRRFR